LTDFLKTNNLVLKPADKGLGICLMHQDFYLSLVNSHLTDEKSYKLITDFKPDEIMTQAYKLIREAKSCNLILPPPNQNYGLGEAYCLIKIHKNPLISRLIVPNYTPSQIH
jgi:hypothetical protein